MGYGVLGLIEFDRKRERESLRTKIRSGGEKDNGMKMEDWIGFG